MRPKDTMPAATAIAKRGLPYDGKQGTPAGPRRVRREWRGLEERDDDDRQEGERGLRQEGAGEQQARNELPRPDHRLGSDDRGRKPAAHDPGDRTRPEGRRSRVGRGEAVALDVGDVEPGREGAEAEREEAAARDAGRGDETAGNAEERAEDVAVAPPKPAHDERGGKRPERDPELDEADRQGREASVRRERKPDDAAERGHDRRGRAAERLRRGEDARVVPRDPVVDHRPLRSGGRSRARSAAPRRRGETRAGPSLP